MRSTLSAAFVFLAIALPAQVDLDQAARELTKTLERPEGTTIGPAQKAALDAFLARYQNVDLGPLGYAVALRRYLDRDVVGAATALDEFFAKHAAIDNDEHRKMAGRIYLGALAAAARAPEVDAAILCRRAEVASRLYGDHAIIARVVGPLLQSDKVDAAALRVSLLRGACGSGAETKDVDAFARALYEGAPPPPPRAVAKSDLVGQPAPAFTATDVVRKSGDGTPLSLSDLRGKVVVLDFFASWCPPCRAALPHLVELQSKHANTVQVVSLTRAYGYGMDFSAADATLPHGGKKVEKLARADEVGLYRGLARAFGVEHPIAFVDADTFAAYGVKSIPTLVVIDRAGRVSGVQVGGDAAGLDALLAAALKE